MIGEDANISDYAAKQLQEPNSCLHPLTVSLPVGSSLREKTVIFTVARHSCQCTASQVSARHTDICRLSKTQGERKGESKLTST